MEYPFAKNLIADEIHQQALRLALDSAEQRDAHGFEEAFFAFNHAREAMGMYETEGERVQLSRIVRDHGFSVVRATLAGIPGASFEAGAALLRESLDLTEPLVSRPVRFPHLTRRRLTPQQQQINTEHGITESLLGDAAVAQLARQGVFRALLGRQSAPPEVIAAQHWYGRRAAHGHAAQGAQPYESVYNAMNGMRAERLNNRLLHVGSWVARAALALVDNNEKWQTVANVRTSIVCRNGLSRQEAVIQGLHGTNLGRAVLQVAKRTPVVLSRQRALAPIVHPRNI